MVSVMVVSEEMGSGDFGETWPYITLVGIEISLSGQTISQMDLARTQAAGSIVGSNVC